VTLVVLPDLQDFAMIVAIPKGAGKMNTLM